MTGKDERKEVYFITRDGEPERQVTKEEYVSAERSAGFRNTLGKPLEPATGAFSSNKHGVKISGRTAYV